MQDFFDIPTIIIIAVAIFVLYRLRSVLGTRTGNERTPMRDIRESRTEREKPDEAPRMDDVVVPLRPDARSERTDPEAAERAQRKFEAELERYVPDNAPLRARLQEIGDADPTFTPKSFINGAGAAYEMIVTAFAAGDRGALRPLLEKDVYEGFEAAIKQREAAGNKVDFTFVGLPNIAYTDASLDKKVANITIRFDAEVVSATRDADGNLVEGDAEKVVNIADEWTFSKNPKSRDPNWKLVGTNQIS
ncbi:MAG: Tim44 domain-containing protein [Hyphomicrobiaceae bacterium]|nr:Tim44 domain-containing protein [Hyphomicrobiaceae bacterium]